MGIPGRVEYVSELPTLEHSRLLLVAFDRRDVPRHIVLGRCGLYRNSLVENKICNFQKTVLTTSIRRRDLGGIWEQFGPGAKFTGMLPFWDC